jgi:hypothetical protein
MKTLSPIVIFFLISIYPTTIFCQNPFVSIGPELAIPGSSSGLEMNAGTGYGGSVRVESSWSNHLSGMLSLGYLVFGDATPYSTELTRTKVKAIVVQAGLKYYISKKIDDPKGFFISTELGLMSTNTRFTYEVYPPRNFKESGLSAAPGIGYLFRKMEAGFRLQYNLSASGFDVYYYNFRLAYAIRKKAAT